MFIGGLRVFGGKLGCFGNFNSWFLKGFLKVKWFRFFGWFFVRCFCEILGFVWLGTYESFGFC